jgi:serine phosphatase RsbU (regulator of sigma subunit)
MKDAQYSELRIEPRPGDRLVLYTDGLLPTASPTHTMRGIPIEMLSITAQRGLDLPEIVRRILSCYQAIHGLQGLDDVTVALIDFLLDAQP